MYRNLAIVAVLLLTLTACNKDNAKQAEHTPEAATTVAHAIAVQPATPAVVQPAQVAPEETVELTPAPAVVVEIKQVTEAAETAIVPNVEVATESSNYTTSIVGVQLENKFGAVFIPHRLHVELYNCATCHGDNVPGKIDKTKKQFHAMCRGCHAKIEAGPTKCGACHQRTK